jgi:transcriptional regulator with XRE-family HTH domain
MTKKIPAGDKIRLARCAKKLSVRQLGELIGMTGGSVSLIERGEVSLKIDQYERIQAALGYDFATAEAEAAFSYFLNGNYE